MTKRGPDVPDLGSLKDILLEAARQHTVDGVLDCLVQGVCTDRPNVAAAAVWMLDSSAPGVTELVLAASASKKTAPVEGAWAKATRLFERLPLTEPSIGVVAKDRKRISAPE